MSAHREFCTLFDSNYLAKAVAMHRSLLEHCGPFRLTAFCFDEAAEQLLSRLDLPNLDIVSLRQLEAHDAELLSVKGDRTPTEYCWTATPALPLYMLQTRPELDEVTYLDADLLFFSDPEPLFTEMGNASVLITPHRYASEYAHQEVNGIYNVQFVTFRRDEPGTECLRWWHERCIEWCYYRHEDGKMGDQKYLDDWPQRFEGVHLLAHKGGGLAPWNIVQYNVHREGRQVMVDDQPLVFFHYHLVKLRERGGYEWRPPGYRIPPGDKVLIYDPYLDALDRAVEEIRRVEPGFTAGMLPPPNMRDRIQTIRANVGARIARGCQPLGRRA